MNPPLETTLRREVWLKRELIVWRVLVILCAAGFRIAARAQQSEREIRLTSADGKNSVVLSAHGLSLQRGARDSRN